MTPAQAKTQQLGALLDLRSWIYNRSIICDPGIAREIDSRVERLRREIRTLRAANQAGDIQSGKPRLAAAVPGE